MFLKIICFTILKNLSNFFDCKKFFYNNFFLIMKSFYNFLFLEILMNILMFKTFNEVNNLFYFFNFLIFFNLVEKSFYLFKNLLFYKKKGKIYKKKLKFNL